MVCGSPHGVIYFVSPCCPSYKLRGRSKSLTRLREACGRKTAPQTCTSPRGTSIRAQDGRLSHWERCLVEPTMPRPETSPLERYVFPQCAWQVFCWATLCHWLSVLFLNSFHIFVLNNYFIAGGRMLIFYFYRSLYGYYLEFFRKE